MPDVSKVNEESCQIILISKNNCDCDFAIIEQPYVEGVVPGREGP